jgi:ABC-type multidrug transport system ATPase subunit
MGVSFRNLSVHAFGRQTDYQRTVFNFLGATISRIFGAVASRSKLRIDILRELDGLVLGGEMLLVLGNPGSGCTTTLKSLAGQTCDLFVDDRTSLNYQGMQFPS